MKYKPYMYTVNCFIQYVNDFIHGKIQLLAPMLTLLSTIDTYFSLEYW